MTDQPDRPEHPPESDLSSDAPRGAAPDASDPSSPDSKRKKKRRWPRITGIVIAILLVVILGLIAAGPTILSTDFGEDWVTSIVSDSIEGAVEIEDLSLSWFGSQRAEEVTLLDPEGDVVANIDTFTTQLSAWNAIWGDYKLGQTDVTGVHAGIIAYEDGTTNLERALAPVEPQPPDQEPLPLDTLAGEITLDDVHVTLTTPGRPPVAVDPLTARVSIPRRAETISVEVDAKVREASPPDPPAGARSGSAGDLKVRGEITGAIGPQGRLTPLQARVDLTVDLTNLPTATVDRLLRMEGQLVAAIGEQLDAHLRIEGNLEQAKLIATARAPRLSAELRAKIRDAVLSLTQPARVKLTAAPPLLAKVLATGEQKPKLTLRGPVPLEITIPRLQAPVTSFDPTAVTLRAELSAGEIALQGDVLGRVGIRNLFASVQTSNPAKRISFEFQARIHTSPASAGAVGKGQLARESIRTTHGQAPRISLAHATPRVGARHGRILRTAFQSAPSASSAANPEDAQPGGRIQAHGTVANLLTAEGQLQLEATRVDARAEVRDLPTMLVDRIARQQTLMTAALGPRINLTVDVQDASATQGRVTVAMHTAKLHLEPATLEIGERITLIEPSTAVYQLQPELVSQFVPEGEEIALAQPVKITAVLEKLSAPLPNIGAAGGSLLVPEQTVVHASVGTSPIQIAGLPELDVLRAKQVSFSLTGESLASLKAQASAVLTQPQGKQLLARMTGSDQVRVGLEAQGGIQLDGLGVWKMLATLSAQRLKLRVPAALTEQGVATLRSPATVQWTITPAALNRLAEADEPILAQPMSIHLSVTDLSVPVTPSLAVDQAQARVEMSVPELVLAGLAGGTIRQISGAVRINAPEEVVRVEMEGQAVTSAEDQPSPIQLTAEARNLLRQGALALEQAQIETYVRVEELPTALADAVTRMHGRLAALLGQTFSVEASARFTAAGEQPVGHVKAALSSPQLEIQTNLAAKLTEKDLIALTQPGQVMLTLGPDAYAALIQMLSQGPDEAGGEAGGEAQTSGATGGASAPTGGEGGGSPPVDPTLTASVTGDSPDAQTVTQTEEFLPLVLLEPTTVNIDLAALSYPSPVSLDTSSAGTSEAQSEKAATFDPSKLAIDASVSVSKAVVMNLRRNERAVLHDMKLMLSTDNLAQELTLVLDGRMSGDIGQRSEGEQQAEAQAEGGGPRPPSEQATQDQSEGQGAPPPASQELTRPAAPQLGPFHLEADLRNLFRAGGKLNLRGISGRIQGNVSGVPVAWLGQLAALPPDQQEALVAALGPLLGAEVSMNLTDGQGPFTVEIVTSNAWMPIEGHLGKGRVKLSQETRIAVEVTPALSHYVLKGVSPIFVSAIDSKGPVVLELGPKGALIPIAPFAFDGLQIPKARLNLGVLVLKNEGPLGVLLAGIEELTSVLQLNALGATAEDLLSTHIEPVVFSVENGVAHYQPFGITLVGPAIRISTSGTVDLERMYVHMIVRLGSGLFKAVGLESLEKGFSIPIVMVGPASNPHIKIEGIVTQLITQLPKAAIKTIFEDLPDSVVGKLVTELPKEVVGKVINVVGEDIIGGVIRGGGELIDDLFGGGDDQKGESKP